MKKLFLLLIISVLMTLGQTHSQTLDDYILAVKGDTLVIKDYHDMGNKPNSLYYALLLDTIDATAGRVYELRANGYYTFYHNPNVDRPTVIVGENPVSVVNNNNITSKPPLICIEPGEYDPNIPLISLKADFTIKNCQLVAAAPDQTIGWTLFTQDKSGIRMLFDNCIMERTFWVMVALKDSNCTVKFRNCYFVNLSGKATWRNSGVLGAQEKQDTLTQGNVYLFEDMPFKRIIINHNTFINNAGSVFRNPGYQDNVSLTNNLFVNSNIYPNNVCLQRDIWDDPDLLPIGLVNVNNIDSANHSQRKFLVQKNLAFWDPLLADFDSILNAGSDTLCWESQMIIMNSRTQDMFDNNAQYPFLTMDTWKNQLPNFTDPKDLFTTQLDVINTYVLDQADEFQDVVLPMWRLTSTGPESFVHPDWPIPVDLSYSDADLQTAGFGGFPLGDLNWFPVEKEQWLAQRPAEYDSIENALNSGRLVTSIKDRNRLPVGFEFQQNYPNPFNPNTTITFSIPKAGHISLKVFNILGQEVATLTDDFMIPKTYKIEFDGSRLASGVYIAKIRSGGSSKSIKMVLLK